MFGFFFERDQTPEEIANNAVNLVETPFGDAIRGSVANAIRQNSPLDFMRRSMELSEKKSESYYVAPPKDPTDPSSYGRPVEGEYRTRRMLTKEQANESYSIPGKLNFDSDITEDAAKVIKARKEEELEIERTLDGAHGIIKNGAMFTTELVTSMLDPLNFAANFIPVVGEARMASMVGRMGRHGARLARGGLEGMVGQGVIEPFAYLTHNQEMSDYTMYQALQSLLMGGLGGAGLHEGFGALGDAIRGVKRRTALSMYKASIGQLAEGKNVHVSPLLDHDPNVTNLSGDAIDEMDFFKTLKDQAIREGLITEAPVEEIAKLRETGGLPPLPDKATFGDVGGTGKTSKDIATEANNAQTVGEKVKMVYEHLFGNDSYAGNHMPLDEKINIMASAWGMFEDPAVPFPLMKEFNEFAMAKRMAKKAEGFEPDSDQFGYPDWDGTTPDQVQAKHEFINEPDVEGKRMPEVNVESQLNMKNLEQVGPSLGGNEGGTFVDKTDGQKWYVKWTQTYDHARNEMLVNLIYRLAGVNVPELRIINDGGKFGIASRWIEGTTPVMDFSTLSPEMILQIQKGFGVDAWLANWDVLGGSGNLHIMPNGEIVRIDQGGGLKYKALGEHKGLGYKVTESATLKDANINPKGAEVYGKMIKEVEDQAIGDVFKISKTDIEKAIELAGYERGTKEFNEMSSLLLGRLHNLEGKYPDVAKIFKNEGTSFLFSHKDAMDTFAGHIKSAYDKIKDLSIFGKIHDALRDYQGSSWTFNKWIRDGMKKSTDSEGYFQDMVKMLDKAISKFKLPETISAYRGVYLDEVSEIFGDKFVTMPGSSFSLENVDPAFIHQLVGQKVKIKNYISTSFGPPSSFSSNRPIEFKFEIPEGYHVTFPDAKTGEKSSFTNAEVEMILPRDTEYYVTRAYFGQHGNRIGDGIDSMSKKLIIEAKVIPKEGPVAKKIKTAKITPEESVQEAINYHKQPSNAADDTPLDLQPGVKKPNEVVKPEEIATEKKVELSTEEKAAISEDITNLERDIALLESDLEDTLGLKKINEENLKGMTNPEDVAAQKEFIDDLKNMLTGYDEKITQSKEKLGALKAAFGCVMGNY